jgi:type I restriction enzyme, S subunit
MMSALPLGGSRPIPKGWKVLSLNEIKSPEPYSCVAGPFGSNISSKYFVEGGVPVIRGQNLTDNLTRFIPDNFVFVTEERARNHYLAQHVKAGDLVFTCWGTIGQAGLIPEDGPYPEYIISNKQLKLRVNQQIADPLFVYYYLASREGVEHIRSRATGSAVPGINLGTLKSIRLCWALLC